MNPIMDGQMHVVEVDVENIGLQNDDENDINVSNPRRTLSAGGRIADSLPNSGQSSRGRSRERRKRDFVSDLGRKSGNLLRQMSRSK